MIGMCSECYGVVPLLGTTSICRVCWEWDHGAPDDYVDTYSEDFDDY